MINFSVWPAPEVFSIGPFSVKWYALAYIIGILYSALFIKKTLRLERAQIEELSIFTILGVILGGRLGYIIFYNYAYYRAFPNEIIKIWQGGMSFHGAGLGMLIAFSIFSKKYKISLLKLLDLAACSAPVGIFFGRIANFINQELWGRITNSSFGIMFPSVDNNLRHPSQLYEALMEGLIPFIILNLLFFYSPLRCYKAGIFTGIFLFLYSLARIIIEFFREADEQIGYFAINLGSINLGSPEGYVLEITLGQILSAPLLLSGLCLIYYSSREVESFRSEL